MLVFHSAYLSAVGTAGASGTSGAGGAASTYCCTPELHARGAAGCEHVGGIVVDPSRLGTGVFRHDLRFAANQSVAAVRTKVARYPYPLPPTPTPTPTPTPHPGGGGA